MPAVDTIKAIAGKAGSITSADIVRKLRISRQAAARYLRAMVDAGVLSKSGSTRSARYALVKGTAVARVQEYRKVYVREALAEDVVFNEIAARMGLKRQLSASGYRIAYYAFTEMLNNAIDHSRSKNITVSVTVSGKEFAFTIRDMGIGVYENVRDRFSLADHFEAVEHLLKGKQTTAPAQHSGQGIFFTSKIADRFTLDSARVRLVVDNHIDDHMVHQIKNCKGTAVTLSINKRTRKDLKALFDEYSNEDFEFDRTTVVVNLSERDTDHISRSQAKRLLTGLEQFKRIVLDFKKVSGIGQGFADEVFRVYQSGHPDTTIEMANANEAVRFMVDRSRKPSLGRE